MIHMIPKSSARPGLFRPPGKNSGHKLIAELSAIIVPEYSVNMIELLICRPFVLKMGVLSLKAVKTKPCNLDYLSGFYTARTIFRQK